MSVPLGHPAPASFCLLLGALLAGCSGPDSSPDPDRGAADPARALSTADPAVHRHLHRAEAFLEVRECERAIEECLAGLERLPDGEPLLVVLSEAAIESGRPEVALERLEPYAARDTIPPAIALALGRCMDASGRRAEGLAVLEAAATAHADSIDIQRALGRVAFDLRRDETSATAYETVRRSAPEDGEALLALGTIYSRLGRHEEAETAFQAAVRAHPNSAPAHRALAAFYASTDRPERAAEHLTRYLEARPDAPDAEWVRERIELLREDGSR